MSEQRCWAMPRSRREGQGAVATPGAGKQLRMQASEAKLHMLEAMVRSKWRTGVAKHAIVDDHGGHCRGAAGQLLETRVALADAQAAKAAAEAKPPRRKAPLRKTRRIEPWTQRKWSRCKALEAAKKAKAGSEFKPRAVKTYPDSSSGRRLPSHSGSPVEKSARRACGGQPSLVAPLWESGGDSLGLRCQRPQAHPALLDGWRALMEHGWSMKHLHRLIVTSAAYRRSAPATRRMQARSRQRLLLEDALAPHGG
jgi:hypothetical protein